MEISLLENRSDDRVALTTACKHVNKLTRLKIRLMSIRPQVNCA